jgi:hypothetical protein
MKVYLVTMDWHYETHIVGVFSSMEKAADEIISQHKDPPNDGSTMNFDIQEMDVQ